ncbi:MAG: hypothetical protein SFZ23_13320 [Planctomycetota bacterium]|nr:hypothetical protein [Planctomycetota bacterium]
MRSQRLISVRVRHLGRGGMLAMSLLGLVAGAGGGCESSGKDSVRLGEIYSSAAQNIGAERNPVVVIPGILGSNLVDRETDTIVWGAFVYGAADADFPDGARLVALPMREGVPLSELRDGVEPDGVLETLEANVSVFKVTALEPYKGIIQTLAAGRYVDRDIALAAAGKRRRSQPSLGEIDYAGQHFTCFQFDYDWRRDISENAARLDELIRDASESAGTARGTGGAAGEGGEPVKVDVVAHSMGGLVLMYYLRYGTQKLPEDGSLPPATWEGARLVENAILVGTPSAGSVMAMKQLVEGVAYAIITPEYRASLLGTMPAIYQLLPRTRHARVVDAQTGEAVSLYEVRTWQRYGWGLADPDQEQYVQWLLPEARDAGERRRIAMDHLRKCLARAEQFHRAIDAPMTGVPEHLRLSISLGDSHSTPSVMEVNPRTGTLRIRERSPGDGTVTRASALMDERTGTGGFAARLRTPIAWSDVQFIPADHVALTTHPTFVDWMLFQLLEKPRANTPRGLN